MYQCSVCNRYSVRANGKQNADWLIVGEYPSYDDLKVGLPFTGKVGEFLSYELARVGIQLTACRLVTAYPHLDTTQECLREHFVNTCMPELLINRKGILLVGNTLTNVLGMVGVNLKDIQGIQLGGIKSLGVQGNVVATGELYGSINGYNGEFRLALKNLKRGIV